MKKIIAIIILTATLVSCTKSEFVEYDNVNGETLLKFEASGDVAVSLPIGRTTTTSVIISSSTVSEVDRTIEVSLNSDDTTLPVELVEFDSSVVLPAGEYTTELTVTITDSELDFTESFALVINLNGISNSGDLSIPNPAVLFDISISCPVPEDFLVGDYEISDVEGTVGPGNGTENFATAVVTLVAEGSSRVFDAAVLPAFNSEIENIALNLNCNVFQLGNVDPGLTCSGGIAYLFTATTRNNSTPYDVAESDDSFIINYIEDPEGSCGGPFNASFRLTKVE